MSAAQASPDLNRRRTTRCVWHRGNCTDKERTAYRRRPAARHDRCHAAPGPRSLLANLGELRPRAVLQEFVIQDLPQRIVERILAEKPNSDVRMHFGLRLGDFDNDYRAVVGIEGVAGRRGYCR